MRRTITLIIICMVTIAAVFPQTPPKVGLTLSGGGALGFAHIGVIQALEENGIKADYVAGTSMGAIIGVLYADGYSAMEMLEIIHKEKLYKIQKLLTLQSAISHMGMSSHEALIKTLHKLLPHNSFDSLQTPFSACVTNLDKGRHEYKSSGGNLAEFVAASASIPAVFEAAVIDGTTYVDGGVMNNLPAEALAMHHCDYIIGVDVLPFIPDVSKHNAIDVMLWSLRIMQGQNSQKGKELCDFLIESDAINEYHEFSFDKYREIYQYGYKAAIDYINKHPEMKKLAKRK